MSTNTSRPLSPEHAAHLARFRIPQEILEATGVQSVTDAEAREMLGLHSHYGADLGGILFPYRSPLTGDRFGARIRLDHPLPDDGGKYISEPGCRHLLFPSGIADILADVTVPVVIVEAEKSGMALMAVAARAGKNFLAIVIGGCWGWRRTIGHRLVPGGGSEPETGPSPDFDVIAWERRPVIIAFDSNASTNSDVRRARWALARELTARGASVLIADVPAEPGVNGPDDLIAISGDDAMLSVLDTARPFAEYAVAEAELALSRIKADKKADPLPVIEAISAVEYPERLALLTTGLAALRIPGVNRKFVEQEVQKHRARAETARVDAAETCRRGRLMSMKVEGAELLDEVSTYVRRFVVLSAAQARVVALWVAHTHAFEAAESTPYLSVTSPEKQCGKTRLLEVSELIVPKPWFTGRITAFSLYRKIDAQSSTLLLDESDAAFKSGDEYGQALRGILNTGHRRGGKATSCVKQGADIVPKDFLTFSPKMIAGIGTLPDTVADRSIPFRLKRKKRDEKVERFRLRNARPEAEQLRERLEAWGAQNLERLRDARPELPEELSDRQQDGAEPLLAIADLVGGEWPQAARDALVSLCCEPQAANDSIGIRLLSDIQQIFVTRNMTRLPSAELARALSEIEASPWGEWNHGKSITPPSLARLLRPFGIAPHNIRTGEKTPKGYETSDFQDAWTRYGRTSSTVSGASPSAEPATPPQANADAGFNEFSKRHVNGDVAAQQCEKANQDAVCGGVAGSASPTAGVVAKPKPREEL